MIFRRVRTVLAPILFPLLLAACQALPPVPESAVLGAPSGGAIVFPAGAVRFVVDPQASEIRLLVFRDGPLARFGHNHVIVGQVRGEVGVGPVATTSGYRLEIPVESLAIDPPAARAQEGEEFAAEVSNEARRGTRDNMLGRDVLDAAGHPIIRIDSVSLTGQLSALAVHARVTLRGATRDLRFQAAAALQGNILTVTAEFPIRQSDFGIAPFSVLGGGLQVRDAIKVHVRLVARRI